ncbi:MAG: hypothetical protein NTW80_02230 [Deltaproteobacteria bacterium]|nr:hypothetical protein [Deltaproteobacteria bacterium]
MKDQKNNKKQADEAGVAMSSFSLSQAAADGRSSQVKRKILVVGKEYGFTPAVMDYATNLAQRLGYDLIGMNLNPGLEQMGKFFSPYNLHLRAKFTQRARAAWETVRLGLLAQGINGEHVVKFAEVAEAVKDLNHEVKRIDFVITDVGIESEEITGEIPLPVFSISGYGGEEIMAQGQEASRRKLVGKTIALGLGSVAIYAAVFWNSGAVMQYFTKGGLFAALPIATVFLVSFVHGSFAHNLWACMGIEATKKVQPRMAPRPAARKRPRPSLRLNA